MVEERKAEAKVLKSTIREVTDNDKSAIWEIIRTVIAGGDTYVFSPNTSEEEIMAYWFGPGKHNYVAEL